MNISQRTVMLKEHWIWHPLIHSDPCWECIQRWPTYSLLTEVLTILGHKNHIQNLNKKLKTHLKNRACINKNKVNIALKYIPLATHTGTHHKDATWFFEWVYTSMFSPIWFAQHKNMKQLTYVVCTTCILPDVFQQNKTAKKNVAITPSYTNHPIGRVNKVQCTIRRLCTETKGNS